MTDEITISKAEYDSKTMKSTWLTILCDTLVRDWIDGERRYYCGISESVKNLLKAFDPGRYAEAEKKVAEVLERQSMNKAAELLRGAVPDGFSHRFTGSPGVPISPITPYDNPLRVEIGDRPDLEPKITCETKE